MYLVVNRPAHTDIENDIPDLHMTTQDFLSELLKDDGSYSKELIEKTIQIEGVIEKITYKNGTYTLLLSGDGSSKLILCEMKKGQESVIQPYEMKDNITLKGVYKGSLLDAIFLHCVISETVINE